MEKIKNNSWLYLVAGVVITANIVTLAMLWIHRGGHDEKHDRTRGPNLFEYLSKELSFSKQQQDAYRELRNEHREGSRRLQDSIRDAKDGLFDMLSQNNAEEAAIIQQSNKAASLGSKLDTFTFLHFKKLRALCTPDQQKKFDGIIREALQMMGPRHGPPPGQH
ncbi:MAG: periplasmic heavy metal sensor [Ferruginibacter sp.]